MSSSVNSRFASITKHLKSTHEYYQHLSSTLLDLTTKVTELSGTFVAHVEGQSEHNLAVGGGINYLTTNALGLITDVGTLKAATATSAAKQDELITGVNALKAVVDCLTGRQEGHDCTLQELAEGVRTLVARSDGVEAYA